MTMSLDVICPLVIPLYSTIWKRHGAVTKLISIRLRMFDFFRSAQGVMFERKGLLLCSTGDPGTPLVLVSAMVGRLFLDACFTLIYLTVVEVFTPSARKTVLPICDLTAEMAA